MNYTCLIGKSQVMPLDTPKHFTYQLLVHTNILKNTPLHNIYNNYNSINQELDIFYSSIQGMKYNYYV